MWVTERSGNGLLIPKREELGADHCTIDDRSLDFLDQQQQFYNETSSFILQLSFHLPRYGILTCAISKDLN